MVGRLAHADRGGAALGTAAGPTLRNPEIPASLAAVVLRCLARRPEDRFGSAVEVEAALEALLGLAPSRSERAGKRLSARAPSVRDKTVAVLPLQNAGAPDDSYLAEGLTDDLIDTLCVTRGLKMRPRSVVMRHATPEHDPRRLGEELDVQVIVEGTIRREGATVRVSARAISVEDELQIWAQRFECPAERLLTLSDEMARAVADALTVDFELPARVSPSDPVAVDLYIRARHALGKHRRALEAERASTSPDSRMRPLFFQLEAELCAFAADSAGALDAIAGAVDARLYDLCWIERCPVPVGLRGSPRFEALRAEVDARTRPIRAELARRDSDPLAAREGGG
jgi:TolB-like protein